MMNALWVCRSSWEDKQAINSAARNNFRIKRFCINQFIYNNLLITIYTVVEGKKKIPSEVNT